MIPHKPSCCCLDQLFTLMCGHHVNGMSKGIALSRLMVDILWPWHILYTQRIKKTCVGKLNSLISLALSDLVLKCVHSSDIHKVSIWDMIKYSRWSGTRGHILSTEWMQTCPLPHSKDRPLSWCPLTWSSFIMNLKNVNTDLFHMQCLHFCPSWERDPSHVALSEVSTFFLPVKRVF